MKSLKSYIYALAAGLALTAVSCVQEEDAPKGVPEDTYGVYFPSQVNIKNHELEPKAEGEDQSHVLEFTAKRLNTEGYISVPLEVTPVEFFTASELKFEDGQKEATFRVTLSDKAQVGVQYKCNVAITDRDYALTYSELNSAMDFSAMIVKWNTLSDASANKFGRWRDDLLGSMFVGVPAFENKKVVVQERADKPGYFRLTKVYTPEYLLESGLFKPGTTPEQLAGNVDPSTVIVIDASNPESVVLPLQRMGFDVGYGPMLMGSFSDKYLNIDPSQSLYGKYDKENGVITFPKDGLIVGDDQNGIFPANSRGLFRFVLPGFSVLDYSVSFNPEAPSTDGTVKIKYAFGSDVAKIKYAVYPGNLSAGQVNDKAKELRNDDGAKVLDVKQGTLTVSGLDKTGTYTLVSANYAAAPSSTTESDAYADCNSVVFNYIKAGDDVPVNLLVEVNATDKYTSQGFTSDRSLEFYIQGQNIQEAYVLPMRGNFSNPGYKDILINQIFKPLINAGQLRPADDEMLAEINGDGYLDIVAALVPETSYSVIVYAFNGYKWDLIAVSAATKGKYNIIYDDFIYDADPQNSDLKPFKDLSSVEGEYDYYAFNLLKGDKFPTREKIGTVQIVNAGEGMLAAVGLTGNGMQAAGVDEPDMMMLPLTESGYFTSMSYPFMSQDVMAEDPFLYYMQDGKIKLPLGPAFIGKTGQQQIITLAVKGLSDALLIGGEVTGVDGSKAIVITSSMQYSQYGYDFTGLGLAAYDSADFGEAVKMFTAYDGLMLIPAGQAATQSAAPARRQLDLKAPNAYRHVKTDINFAGIKGEREPKSVDFNSTVSEGQLSGNQAFELRTNKSNLSLR